MYVYALKPFSAYAYPERQSPCVWRRMSRLRCHSGTNSLGLSNHVLDGNTHWRESLREGLNDPC